jgi:hypothetical protein
LFIPLEIFELARHFTLTKLVVTLINVLIVWYLVARVRFALRGLVGHSLARSTHVTQASQGILHYKGICKC